MTSLGESNYGRNEVFHFFVRNHGYRTDDREREASAHARMLDG